MKKFCCISLIILLLGVWSIYTMAEVNGTESDTWQNVFFLKDGGRDMDRLRRAMGPEDSPVQKDMKRILEEKSKLEGKDAAVDYSKVFISYDISMESLLEYYENGETDLGYDGLPDSDWLFRNICVPIFQDGKVTGQFRFRDFQPDNELGTAPHTTVSPNDIGGFLWLEYGSEYCYTSYSDTFRYAEMGYDIVAAMGADIQAIFCLEDDHRVMLKTDEEIYVYPVYNIEEPEKGNQAMPLEEFVRASYMGQIAVEPVFVTPEPTPTPTPTPAPRPSRTAAVTLRPTVVTPTATPSAGETAALTLTATASLFPSSSSAPEQSAGSAVLIVIVGVLVIAAAGAVGWAAFRKKKGKE